MAEPAQRLPLSSRYLGRFFVAAAAQCRVPCGMAQWSRVRRRVGTACELRAAGLQQNRAPSRWPPPLAASEPEPPRLNSPPAFPSLRTRIHEPARHLLAAWQSPRAYSPAIRPATPPESGRREIPVRSRQKDLFRGIARSQRCKISRQTSIRTICAGSRFDFAEDRPLKQEDHRTTPAGQGPHHWGG